MIKIKVKCFSQIKYALGKDYLDLELKKGTTSENLEAHIRKVAEGKLDGINFRIAINKKYSTSNKILMNGDEVAFIPPVQGGQLIDIQIVNQPIIYFEHEENRNKDGSELLFNGRVRSKEGDNLIKELEYEQYEGMALSELTNLANESLNKYPISDLFCKHRIGKVKVGETSLHVVIWSKHRKEGFKAMSYFISELKKRVPIWKWAILQDGTKIPSECSHD